MRNLCVHPRITLRNKAQPVTSRYLRWSRLQSKKQNTLTIFKFFNSKEENFPTGFMTCLYGCKYFGCKSRKYIQKYVLCYH